MNPKFLSAFSKFRAGKGFLLTLSCFLVLWFALCHIFPGFDPELLRLNLLLSVEAAYALPVLMMEQERQKKAQSDQMVIHAKQLEYIADLSESVIKLLQVKIDDARSECHTLNSRNRDDI